MRGRRKSTTTAVDVVASVREQAEQAAALAGISGQDRLADPRLNPATRAHADELRTAQQITALEAEHGRALRRDRVLDARAAEAEATLEAIALARRASSSARSVKALADGRRRWSRLALGASVVLAAGSAMGVEAAAHVLEAPRGTGYVAELGLTGLSTAAIAYRAHLAEHRGTLARGSWQLRALWALMTVPLLASVIANVSMLNALGAACSIGAGAFALLGAVVADRSAAAMQARAAEVDAADEAGLRAVAMGQEPDEAPDEAPGGVPGSRDGGIAGSLDAGIEVAARAGVDELAAWLADREPPAAGAVPAGAPVPGGGPVGAARGLRPGLGEAPGEGVCPRHGGMVLGDRGGGGPVPMPALPAGGDGGRIEGPGGHIDSDPDDGPDGALDPGGPDEGARRVWAAAEARRAAGDATRARVAAVLDTTPGASVREIAGALGISEATAKRHRRALRSGAES
ncbi:hypothetical protein AGRA3207_007878 (plasmid) [Actinomadura graeca]|uniref:HTH arsR-type domain-containing protein n=1 Tax=Actinomadura graeca TaxID=2750812 RepID=A0ABX8R7N9_9ACTN|nr:hypothetical protein [Actinomadura graeca]QXJ27080.1 hypothetical protein AGRA3207_007878 [Actinomadura graeca]